MLVVENDSIWVSTANEANIPTSYLIDKASDAEVQNLPRLLDDIDVFARPELFQFFICHLDESIMGIRP